MERQKSVRILKKIRVDKGIWQFVSLQRMFAPVGQPSAWSKWLLRIPAKPITIRGSCRSAIREDGACQ